jgi:hypothetical protein
MTEDQVELEKLIGSVRDLNFLYDHRKAKLSEAAFLETLAKENEENRQVLEKIEHLLSRGLSLDFKTINNHSAMDIAVVQNNVDLVKLLLKYGAVLRTDGISSLCRAAEFGADRVVKFLVEEKGMPVRKTSTDYSALAAARSSKYSRNVVPYLVEVLKSAPPPPQPSRAKNKSDLIKEELLKYLPQIDLIEGHRCKTEDIIGALFLEEPSVSISEFYESFVEQEPTMVFACLELIAKAAPSAPKDKTIKKVPNSSYIHHGNLFVTADVKVNSLAVTGNLVVKGKLSNFEGASLFVGGDLECSSMYTEGPVIIGGNLTADVVEAVYNDYGLDVKNTLKASKLIVDHHDVQAKVFEVENRVDKT